MNKQDFKGLALKEEKDYSGQKKSREENREGNTTCRGFGGGGVTRGRVAENSIRNTSWDGFLRVSSPGTPTSIKIAPHIISEITQYSSFKHLKCLFYLPHSHCQ